MSGKKHELGELLNHNRSKTPKQMAVGKKFAGTLATRLEAHPPSVDRERLDTEKRILDLIRRVRVAPPGDAVSFDFLSELVEFHTEEYGVSKPLQDQLFSLQQQLLAVPEGPEVRAAPLRAPPPAAKRAAGRPQPEDLAEALRNGRPPRTIKG